MATAVAEINKEQMEKDFSCSERKGRRNALITDDAAHMANVSDEKKTELEAELMNKLAINDGNNNKDAGK